VTEPNLVRHVSDVYRLLSGPAEACAAHGVRPDVDARDAGRAPPADRRQIGRVLLGRQDLHDRAADLPAGLAGLGVPAGLAFGPGEQRSGFGRHRRQEAARVQVAAAHDPGRQEPRRQGEDRDLVPLLRTERAEVGPFDERRPGGGDRVGRVDGLLELGGDQR
jgi:hypothetical protein